jgi:hypothetical protein
MTCLTGPLAYGRRPGCYHAILAWELDVCAAEPPAKLKPLRDAYRGIAGFMVGDVIKRLPDELSRAVQDIRNGSREFNVTVNFASPPQLAKFIEQMDKVTAHSEWGYG